MARSILQEVRWWQKRRRPYGSQWQCGSVFHSGSGNPGKSAKNVPRHPWSVAQPRQLEPDDGWFTCVQVSNQSHIPMFSVNKLISQRAHGSANSSIFGGVGFYEPRKQIWGKILYSRCCLVITWTLWITEITWIIFLSRVGFARSNIQLTGHLNIFFEKKDLLTLTHTAWSGV